MNKAFIIYFLLFFCIKINSQNNLIPDGGFESYSSCPFIGGIGLYSNNWFEPTLGSPDLFNTCSSPIDAGVPKNVFGFQYPHNGNGYAGAVLRLNFNTDYKEYFSVELIDSLLKNHTYKLELFVSLSDSSWIALNRISALFSNDNLSSYNGIFNTLPLSPQIDLICNQCYFSDTSIWVKLESNYIADGGEKFITIGSFVTNIAQQIYTLKPINNALDSNSTRAMSYYYFDDISLTDLSNSNTTEPIFANIFTPNKDGINDVWELDLSMYNGTEINIYDRWGLKVFNSKSQKIIWDGRNTSGKECSSGLYYYFISTETENFKGFIQLIK